MGTNWQKCQWGQIWHCKNDDNGDNDDNDDNDRSDDNSLNIIYYIVFQL